MNGAQIAGIVRAIAAAVGGYLVGTGKLDGATVEPIVGALAALAAAVWSVVEKQRAKAP